MISVKDFSEKQIAVYFPAKGDKLTFLNDNLVIRDKEGKIKHQSTCYRLFALFVVGNTTITTGLIQRAKKFGFSICFFSQGMKLYDIIGSRLEGNTLLRKHQYEYQGLALGQHIVENKLQNQRTALHKIRNKTIDNKNAIRQLDKHIENLQSGQLPLLSLLGIEGSASKAYFPEIFDRTAWNGRKPRIKSDYVNTTLDIGYTVLFNVVDAILNIFGFDTYYGVLHRCFYMRKSLVCDLMEPFRPIIDMTVRKGLGLHQINEKDFELQGQRVVLKWSKSAAYTGLFLKAILEYKEELFLYIQGYYRKFMKGAPAKEFPVFLLK